MEGKAVRWSACTAQDSVWYSPYRRRLRVFEYCALVNLLDRETAVTTVHVRQFLNSIFILCSSLSRNSQ